jgi:hypothetical protein
MKRPDRAAARNGAKVALMLFTQSSAQARTQPGTPLAAPASGFEAMTIRNARKWRGNAFRTFDRSMSA